MVDDDGVNSQGIGVGGGEQDPFGVEGWSRASAQSILKMRFGDDDCRRMIQLESKAAQTTLTEVEEVELASYEQIAVFLEYLKRSARDYLQQDSSEEAARS